MTYDITILRASIPGTPADIKRMIRECFGLADDAAVFVVVTRGGAQ